MNDKTKWTARQDSAAILRYVRIFGKSVPLTAEDILSGLRRGAQAERAVDEVLREIIEQAHMAGQADAGVDPGYSNARAYYDRLFSST